jgi:hypothetical protein
MWRRVDWLIVTNVSPECSASIVSVKQLNNSNYQQVSVRTIYNIPPKPLSPILATVGPLKTLLYTNLKPDVINFLQTIRSNVPQIKDIDNIDTVYIK